MQVEGNKSQLKIDISVRPANLIILTRTVKIVRCTTEYKPLDKLTEQSRLPESDAVSSAAQFSPYTNKKIVWSLSIALGQAFRKKVRCDGTADSEDARFSLVYSAYMRAIRNIENPID